ncbi:MAG: type III pantothenate kinase [Candidatus Omnitrophica bacterium]|nr:type III pantothenate kinase [Candidatus Omnitrophota bacterium]
MDLLIDIGNTKCSLALSEGGKPREKFFIGTDKREVRAASLERLLGKLKQEIDKVVIVSVVPVFLRVFIKGLKEVLPDAEFLIVGEDLKVPMPVRYDAPEEIGQDRLVTAYAALDVASAPLLVIDFGTAVTFDLVGDEGAYEGGLIFPGLRLSLENLEQRTALLPVVEPHDFRGLLGRNTAGSMNKGIILGYASLCEGIVNRFREHAGKGLTVVATGGDSALITRYTRAVDRVIPDLIFRGLSLLSF